MASLLDTILERYEMIQDDAPENDVPAEGPASSPPVPPVPARAMSAVPDWAVALAVATLEALALTEGAAEVAAALARHEQGAATRALGMLVGSEPRAGDWASAAELATAIGACRPPAPEPGEPDAPWGGMWDAAAGGADNAAIP